VPESLKTGLIFGEIRRRKWHEMTPILAKVIAVDKQGDQYRAIIQIVLRGYRGSFNTLSFGENKPSLGSYHNGRLDLFYYRDPGLKSGEVVPALDDYVI
jgi:hypothetical protein